MDDIKSLKPETMFHHMRERLPILCEDGDARVKRMMRWHFSEETGSPFWLRKKPHLGFDPVQDIESLDSLRYFGLFNKEELRAISLKDLIPRGLSDRHRRVLETGGTTGAPCRIVDVNINTHNVTIYRTMLEARGLMGGDALAMTPSGPHAYGRFVISLVDSWKGSTYFIDFDPRWVKRIIRDEKIAQQYIGHLCEQAIVILQTQRPSLLFTTSRLLSELVLRLSQPLSHFGVQAVCTGGTCCSPEERRHLQDNYLQGIQWIDTYGNTLMGHALQGDPWTDCPVSSYYLIPPLSYIRVVSYEDWNRQVEYGTRGQVLLSTLWDELFIPNLLERDSAVRVGPHPWFPLDGVRNIGIIPGAHENEMIEGVY